LAGWMAVPSDGERVELWAAPTAEQTAARKVARLAFLPVDQWVVPMAAP
jgi:hypothetical protein